MPIVFVIGLDLLYIAASKKTIIRKVYVLHAMEMKSANNYDKPTT